MQCTETKLLDLNKEKSCYILIGDNRATKTISNELKLFPLTLYGEIMKEKVSEKYLGDFIHGGGVAKSAEVTVVERCGRMFSTNNEIRAIVEGCRRNILGGLKVGHDVWETAYILVS